MIRLLQFTGAQGTGKSTLVKHLRDHHFPDSLFIGEVSRTLLHTGVVANVDVKASCMEQMLINAELIWQYFDNIHNALNKHNGAEFSDKIIFAERTAIDCLAYTNLLQASSNIDISSRFLEYVQDYTIRFLKSTNNIKSLVVHTFYIPPLIPFEHDNVRMAESQLAVDKAIKTILNIYQINHSTVNMSDFQERVSFVIDIIRGLS